MTEIPGGRRLPLADMVERHPKDGWTLAEPLPMSAASVRALEGIVRALLPSRPAPRTAEIEQRVATHVRRMLQYMPPALRVGFVLLLRLLDWSPVWRLQAFGRISTLEPQVGGKILAGVAASRFMLLRLMMLAPKAVVMSTYYDQDEVHRELGYEPKGFMRERIVRREQLLAAENAQVAYESAEVAE